MLLNPSGDLYYKAGVDAGFQALEGITDVTHMSISADGQHIWATTTDERLFHRAGPDATAQWVEHAGKSKYLDVGGNGEHIVFVNSSGDVYYKNGVDAGFEAIEGVSGMSRVTCSAVSGPKDVCFWGCTEDGTIFYKPGKDAAWEEHAGKSKHIHVAGNGSHIVLLNGKHIDLTFN